MAGNRYTFSVEAGTLTPNSLNNLHQDRAKTCQGIINLFVGLDAGNWRGGRVEVHMGGGWGNGVQSPQTVNYSGSSGAQTISVQGEGQGAVGVLTLSGGTGAVGGTIGGTLVTATWATSDLNTCNLIAAAINANTTANKFVAAAASVATATATVATGSGTETITVGGVAISVTWATSDTATAAALAAAINASPTAPVAATSAAGVVTMYSRTPGTAGNAITLAVSGTGMSKSGATLAGAGTNANVLVSALTDGSSGLGITLAASGTGVTASTGANLIGGNMTAATSVSFQAGATDALTVQNAITAIRASPAMVGLVFVPTPPQYGATINQGSTLTLWANTMPTANVAGNSLYLSVTGTGASIGNATGSFGPGVNATPNGFNV